MLEWAIKETEANNSNDINWNKLTSIQKIQAPLVVWIVVAKKFVMFDKAPKTRAAQHHVWTTLEVKDAKLSK